MTARTIAKPVISIAQVVGSGGAAKASSRTPETPIVPIGLARPVIRLKPCKLLFSGLDEANSYRLLRNERSV